MSTPELGRTVPRVAAPASDQTADHVTTGGAITTGTGASQTTHPASSVSEYTILGELGSGGMGVVYKARHTKLNRVVAIKLMRHGERVERGDLIRFLAEAEAVAAVKHPNVVEVYDYGEMDGQPYMALEYLGGGSLADSLEGKLPARRAAQLVARIARGVAAAHALGIVHRDLKPGNVLLDEEGVPKVADFGLAKRGGADVTRTGQVMGTPAYMSPEQARGQSKFVGPQADVWALGVILYQTLTGRRPFTGGVQEVLAAVLSAHPTPPRKLVPSLPHDLELICLHCLAKAPHERYPTAKELADDLDRHLRGEPISVRPAGPLERGYKWVKRNPFISGAAATAALALLVGSGASLAFGLEAREKKKHAEQKEGEAKISAADAVREWGNARTAEGKAIVARDEAQQELARALLGPLSGVRRDEPLSVYEVDASWRVCAHRGTPVPSRFLVEGMGTPQTCRQLACRADIAFHAAIGLSLEERDLADQRLLSRLEASDTTPDQCTDLALAAVWSRPRSSRVAARAANVLVDTMAKNPSAQAEAAPGLFIATGRMEPAEAADACKRAAAILVAALAATDGPVEIRELSLALGWVLAAMPPEEVARVVAEVRSRSKRPGGERWAEGLLSAVAQMEPTRAAQYLAALILRDPTPPFWLERALIDLAPRLDPAEAVKLLTSVRGKTTNTQNLNTAIEAATARRDNPGGAAVPPAKTKGGLIDDPAEVLNTFLPRLQSAPPELVTILKTAGSLPPAEAAKAYERAAELMLKVMANWQHVGELRLYAIGLSAVTAKLESRRAAELCGRAADILTKAADRNADPGFLADFADAVAVIALRLERARASAFGEVTARQLVTAMRKVPTRPDGAPTVEGPLASALVRVVGVMEPAAGAQALTAASLATSHSMVLRELVRGQLLLAARVSPEAGATVLLEAISQNRSPEARAVLGEGFTAIVFGWPIPDRPINTPPAPTHPQRPQPLPAQALVELLKHPFCTGDARRVVLDALGMTYKQRFADQWEFVEYAQKHQTQLDLMTPPRRQKP